MKFPILSGNPAFHIAILSAILLVTIPCMIVLVFLYLDMRRKTEKTVSRLTRNLNRTEDNKTLLLTTLSREIRNSMISVMGMDELILRESTDPLIRERASYIRSSSEDILALMQGAIDYTKIERGLIDNVRDEFDLTSLLVDSISMAGPLFKNKGLILDISADREAPKTLIGDFPKIKRCMMNLFSFICKNSEKGYVNLAIEYSKADDTHADILFRIYGKKIMVNVDRVRAVISSDPSDNKLIFSQSDAGNLDLYLASGVLKALGSELDIDEEEGRGVELFFKMRFEVVNWNGIGDIRRASKNKKASNGEKKDKFISKGARILFADSNETCVSIAKELISGTGVLFDTALTSDEALTLISINEYDVIFVEENMKDDKGIDLIRRIRGGNYNVINSHKPCIAITSNPGNKILDIFDRDTFDAYIGKPLNADEFEDCLVKFMPSDKIDVLDDSQIFPGIGSVEDIRKYSEGYDELYKIAGSIYKRSRSYREGEG
ncbi:MAG: hypothetical protein K5871_06985 [Lachnospiraceae bacterium]|nr:hypothetical protein [Lachnospiraceae bacterium]